MAYYKAFQQIWLYVVLLVFGLLLFSIDRLGANLTLKFETSTARTTTVGTDEDRNVLIGTFTAEAMDHNSSDESQVVPKDFRASPPPTIGLVDYCVGDTYATLKKLVEYNRQAYADKWGCTIFSGNEEVMPVQTFVKPLAWLKAAYFHQLLTSAQAQDIEWFLWMDCDALITRFDLSIAEVLLDVNSQPEHHIVVAQDPHTEFNSGVMFVRNSEWSRDLWKHTLQKASSNATREHKWWEQQALLELYRENQHDEVSHILITPDRWKINAFQTFRRNEFNASSFALHRVNCRKQPDCNDLFESFFCVTMPNGSYPEDLLDCSNATDTFMTTIS